MRWRSALFLDFFFFSNAASIYDRSRDSVRTSLSCAVLLCDGPLSPVFPSSLTRLCRIQHVAASIGSCGNHAIAHCLVKDVPPTSRGIVHAICKFLQSGSNVLLMTCLWWQLTHDITVHILRLPLKKGCFEINMKKIPTSIGCLLATHSKSWSCGSRGIGLLVTLLLVLETPQYPSGLCLEEVAQLVRLDGEHASSGHFLMSMRSKTSLSTEDVYSRVFASANCL